MVRGFMDNPNPSARKANFAVAAALFAGGLGIFWLPWFVPMRTRAAGLSYVYGFNNATSNLAFAGLLIALFWILFRRREAMGSGVTERRLSGLLFSAAGEEGFLDRRLRLAFLIITPLAVAAVGIWFRIVPYRYYAEFNFFVSRLDLMALGLKPYRDFQMMYGPGMLYPQYWLYRLFNGRLSIDGAYGITLAAHWAAGLWLLYYVVGNLRGRVNRALIFTCTAVTLFNFTLGLTYTPLRFTCVPAALFCIHRMFSGRRDDGMASVVKIAGPAFLLPLGVLSLSPEMGVASVAGIAVYFASMAWRRGGRKWGWVALAPCAALAAAVAVFSRRYLLEVLLGRASVGATFPVFPTLYVLLLAAAACWILPQLAIIGICGGGEGIGNNGKDGRNGNDGQGALALGLVFSLGLMIPACLARCDNGHVFSNGLGLFLLFPALVMQLENKAASRALMALYIAICPVLGTVLSIEYFSDQAHDALQERWELAQLEREGKFDPARNAERWREAAGASAGSEGGLVFGKLLPFPEDLKGLLRCPKIGIPLGADEKIEEFLKLSGRYIPEYYMGTGVEMEPEIARKLNDLRRMEIILVPKSFVIAWQKATEADFERSDNKFLRSLLMFPVSLKARNPRLSAAMEITGAIMEQYQVMGEFRGNWVMRRNAEKLKI